MSKVKNDSSKKNNFLLFSVLTNFSSIFCKIFIDTLTLSEFLKIILIQMIKLLHQNFVLTMHLHVLLTNPIFMFS